MNCLRMRLLHHVLSLLRVRSLRDVSRSGTVWMNRLLLDLVVLHPFGAMWRGMDRGDWRVSAGLSLWRTWWLFFGLRLLRLQRFFLSGFGS